VKTNSTLVEIFIEFKWDTGDDIFSGTRELNPDPLQPVVREGKQPRDTLGQITSYAAAQLGAQFRTHIFSVFIVRENARLLRWDRSGAIVTDVIKYSESKLLTEFLFRYSKAPDAMRGRDASVSDPSHAEALAAARALQLTGPVSLVKLSIPDADGDRYFVVPAPKATLYTPPGRATRGFKAYDVSKETVVFLKDSWRIDLPDILAEGVIYKILNNANARHIPRCLASGDISSIEYHATKTHLYAVELAAGRKVEAHFIPHRHHRLVLDVVGRVLVEYESSFEMVSAVRDALIGEFLHHGHTKC
jgi:hypothetical protein